ncbi:MAG: type II toxin-antitoxin system HicA family toxin [Pirellulales bacterium]
MSELPQATGQETINALTRLGFHVARVKGSHHIMKRAGHRHVITVPAHGSKPLKRGTLRSILRSAGFTVAEFCEALK